MPWDPLYPFKQVYWKFGDPVKGDGEIIPTPIIYDPPYSENPPHNELGPQRSTSTLENLLGSRTKTITKRKRKRRRGKTLLLGVWYRQKKRMKMSKYWRGKRARFLK